MNIQKNNTDMKTYAKRVSENTVVVGGNDQFGRKEDLLQVTEEVNHGQTYFRVYFLCDQDGHALKTFDNETQAIDACRKSLRHIKKPGEKINVRALQLEL